MWRLNINRRFRNVIEFDFTKFISGQPIPRVHYSEDEHKTWQTVYAQCKSLYPTMACSAHVRIFKMLEDRGIYNEEYVPQLEDVSNFLKGE